MLVLFCVYCTVLKQTHRDHTQAVKYNLQVPKAAARLSPTQARLVGVRGRAYCSAASKLLNQVFFYCVSQPRDTQKRQS